MAKLTISNDYVFHQDIIGIVSSVSDYKLAHLINKNLLIHLNRIKDHEVFSKKQNQYFNFNMFHFLDELNRREYILLKNKSDSNLCLPEFKIFDYLYLVLSSEEQIILSEDLTKLKAINEISTCIFVACEKIKSKANLIFDENSF